MRILIGSYPAVTILEGGIRTQATSLCRELKELGHETELFETWRSYGPREWDWFYLVGAHIGTVHLARAVKDLGMRLAVSPVFFSSRSASGLKTRLGWSGFWQRFGRLFSELDVTHEICELADLVLPNTQAEAQLVTGGLRIPEHKVRIVPNGCDERSYSASPECFVRQYGKKDFVLFTGHVGLGRKRLLNLIQAMQQIEAPLVVVGKVLDNEYSRRCQDALKLLKDGLLIPGLAHDAELLASAYAACSVFCLPSLFETPGLSALEAALAGARIVITGQGGTKEYFGDWARYVKPDDIPGLGGALKNALQAPRSTELREHIRARFLWRHAAEKLGQYLRDYPQIAQMTQMS